MPAENVLECRGLRRRFGEIVAVAGLGSASPPPRPTGLLGPNGAGKTTTISMIAGLLERDGGAITVDGEPMTTGSGVSRRMLATPTSSATVIAGKPSAGC